MGGIELWGGLECTVARVGNAYSDQSERTGHDERLDDLDRFAALGLRALRYPALWERAPQWEWLDERLGRIRELGMRPILGLVHHGSGPPHTSLLDPDFAEKLAAYAGEVAERYPWVEDWTPVNEPLTTARFSCLYGFWYPHRRDAESFARALVNQLRAVVLAMREIRKVTPQARLVQTDDLGKTHSTAQLRYQAEHENERRWVTWDLLCGRRSAIHDWFTYVGIGDDELAWFVDNPCRPYVVGINHYLSSERFLDHRLHRYPLELHGSNGRDAYVDELAARVVGRGLDGPLALLGEAWERYRLPLALTEVHNGCTREEQLRWLDELWRAACGARDAGADVRAVTVWSLLGASGWDRLLTTGDRYEPGVFDVRAPAPRPTALATMTRSLAESGSFAHPVLGAPGWWKRSDRFWYPPFGRVLPTPRASPSPLLITGATGTLGRGFARVCELRGLSYRLLGRRRLDITDPAAAVEALDAIRPWAVVNAAGYVRVDDAEVDPDRCRRENVTGAAVLAAACAQAGIAYVTFSSDLVFDGRKCAPYVESDPVAPLSVYGASKADAERAVAAAHANALVIRTSAFFGPWDEFNVVHAALAALEASQAFEAADDAIVSPTYVPDLAHAALDLLIDGESGIWHLANVGAVSWYELIGRAAAAADVNADQLVAASTRALGPIATRPQYSVLGSERGTLLPTLDEAIERFAVERELPPNSGVDQPPRPAVTRSG